MSTETAKIKENFLEMGKTRIKILPPLHRGRERTSDYCHQCEGEIYEGEDYFRIDGRAVCVDCLSQFAEEYFQPCRITGGRTSNYDTV